jgi:two-component SAPR family response regulator
MSPMNGFELYRKLREMDNNIEAGFISAFEDYRQEFKDSFPKLNEAKYFIRKPKAIKVLATHVATILGYCRQKRLLMHGMVHIRNKRIFDEFEHQIIMVIRHY